MHDLYYKIKNNMYLAALKFSNYGVNVYFLRITATIVSKFIGLGQKHRT